MKSYPLMGRVGVASLASLTLRRRPLVHNLTIPPELRIMLFEFEPEFHGTHLPGLRNGPPAPRANIAATVICPWILPCRSMQDITTLAHNIHSIHP
jgi:hypothetical protein